MTDNELDGFLEESAGAAPAAVNDGDLDSFLESSDKEAESTDNPLSDEVLDAGERTLGVMNPNRMGEQAIEDSRIMREQDVIAEREANRPQLRASTPEEMHGTVGVRNPRNVEVKDYRPDQKVAGTLLSPVRGVKNVGTGGLRFIATLADGRRGRGETIADNVIDFADFIDKAWEYHAPENIEDAPIQSYINGAATGISSFAFGGKAMIPMAGTESYQSLMEEAKKDGFDDNAARKYAAESALGNMLTTAAFYYAPWRKFLSGGASEKAAFEPFINPANRTFSKMAKAYGDVVFRNGLKTQAAAGAQAAGILGVQGAMNEAIGEQMANEGRSELDPENRIDWSNVTMTGLEEGAKSIPVSVVMAGLHLAGTRKRVMKTAEEGVYNTIYEGDKGGGYDPEGVARMARNFPEGHLRALDAIRDGKPITSDIIDAAGFPSSMKPDAFVDYIKAADRFANGKLREFVRKASFRSGREEIGADGMPSEADAFRGQNERMAAALAERGETPVRFTIPTDAEGKPSIATVSHKNPTSGETDTVKIIHDENSGITVFDTGDGSQVVSDGDGNSYDAASVDEAVAAADSLVLGEQLLNSNRNRNREVVGAIVQEKYPDRAIGIVNTMEDFLSSVNGAINENGGALGLTSVKDLTENGAFSMDAGTVTTPDGTTVIILDNLRNPEDADKQLAIAANANGTVMFTNSNGEITVRPDAMQTEEEDAAAQSAYEDDLVAQLPAMEARLAEMDANGADKSSRDYKQLVSDINAAKKIVSKRGKLTAEEVDNLPEVAETVENAPTGAPSATDATTPPAKTKPVQARSRVSDDVVPNGMKTKVGLIREDIAARIAEIDPNIEIVGIDFHGSRIRGDNRNDSDFDAVVEFNGDWSEDALFNELHGKDMLKIDGITVDINPIRADKTGTLADYMRQSRQLDFTREFESGAVGYKGLRTALKSGYTPYATAEKQTQIAKMNESNVVSNLKLAGENDAKNLVATTPKSQQLLDDAFALSKTFRGQMSKRLTDKLAKAGEKTLEDAVDEAGHYIAIADGNVPQPLKDAFAAAQEKLVEQKRTTGAMSGVERSKAASIEEFAKVPPEQGGAMYDPEIEQTLLKGGFFNPPDKNDVLWDYVQQNGLQSFVFKPQESKKIGGNDSKVIELAERLGFPTEVSGRGENTGAVAEQIIDAALTERERYQAWKSEQKENYANDRLAKAKSEVAEIAKGKRKTWLANATEADLDDLAEAQKRGELDEDYANAVAFVENGADSLDAAIVSPDALRIAKPFWDRIRLDHQKKTFALVDYDPKNGIMTIADDSGRGEITEKQIHYYEVTDKGFKEIENGPRNETGASQPQSADAQEQGKGGEVRSARHDNRPSDAARGKHQRRYGVLAGRGEGDVEGVREAVSALKNGESIRAIDADYSISNDDIRKWQDSAVGEKIVSREDAAHVFMRLSNPTKEIPKVLYVAKDGTILKASVTGVGGTIGQTSMSQRAVIEGAPEGCYGVIVSHNHPNGSVKPSADDIKWAIFFSKQDLGGLKFIDDIVTDTDRFVSIAAGSEWWKPLDKLDNSFFGEKTTIPIPEDRFNIVPYDERIDPAKPLADGRISGSESLRPMIEKVSSVDKNGSYVVLMSDNGVVNGIVAIPDDATKLTGIVRGARRFAVLVGTDAIDRKAVSDALDAAVELDGEAERDNNFGIIYSYSLGNGDYELKTGKRSNDAFVKLGKSAKPTPKKSLEVSKTETATPKKKSVSTKKPTGENAKKAADALARIKGVLKADIAKLELSDKKFATIISTYGTTEDFNDALLLLPSGKMISSKRGTIGHDAFGVMRLKENKNRLDKYLDEHPEAEDAYSTEMDKAIAALNAEFKRRGLNPNTRRKLAAAGIIAEAKVLDGRTVSAKDALDAAIERESSKGISDILKDGAIRIASNNGGLEVYGIPTTQQIDRIYDYVDWQNGNNPFAQFSVDIVGKGGKKASVSYSTHTPAGKIVSDIRSFVETGKIPENVGSRLAEFLHANIADTEPRSLTKEEKRELRNATEDLMEALDGASFDEVARYIADADPALYRKFKPFLKNAYNSATDGDLTTEQANEIFGKIDTDLKEVSDDNQTTQQPAGELRGTEGSSGEESHGTSGGRGGVSSSTGKRGGGRVRGGGGGVGPRANAVGDAGAEGGSGSESSEAQPELGGRAEQPAGHGTDGGVNRPVGGGVAEQGGAGDVQSSGGLDEVGGEREEVTPGFMAYEPPADLPVKAPKSDNLIVETSALASVNVPPIVRKPDMDDSIPRDGVLQAHQYQAVCQVVNAHDQTLPSGERTGYLVADGTGCGKTRIIAGVMLDAVNRKLGGGKAVMVSQKRDLFNDALKDFTPFGISNRLFELDKYGKDSPTHKRSTGIAFTTYNNLSDNYAGIGRDGEVKSANKRGKTDSRFGDLVKWLGKDFDGIIALDEVHTASKEREGRTSKQASYAQTVIDLQEAFPKARVVYLTATAAYNADDLRILTRLGIWGKRTGFETRNDFVSAANRGGMSMLEVLTQGLKARGLYCSRSISFKGVECRRVVHNLTDRQIAMYNQVRDTLTRVFVAMHEAGGMCGLNGKEMGLKSRNFFGAAQNLINTTVTSFKTQTAIDLGRQALKDGKSPVFQLITTNDAAKTFKTEEARRSQTLELLSGDEGEPEVSVKDNIIKFISGPTFPTREFLGRTKGGGAEWGREIPEAVALQKEMLALARQLPDIGNPIDVLVKEFADIGISKVKGGMSKNVRVAEVDKFNNGQNLALVFSGAGGTGSSYHADKRFANQRQRVQIPIEFGWEPDKFIQALGRSHRNNQVVAPEFMLLSTNLAGENRFMSTIASRVSSMGAIVGGDRNSSGQVISESDSLENKYGRAAVKDFADKVKSGTGYAGLSGDEILNGMYLDAEKLDELTVKKFLARLLFLSPEQQNAIYGDLMDKVDASIAKAKEDGTYDNGIRKIDAQRVEVRGRESMSAGDNASQNRDLLTVGEIYPSKRVTLDELRKRIPETSRLSLMRNKRSKEVYAVIESRNRTLRYAPNGTYEELDALELQNYETVDKKIGEAEWQKKYDVIPATREMTRHYMTGDLIPVWSKMGIENPQVYRAQPQNARPFIGVYIPDNDLPSTLYGFGFKDRARQIFAETAFRGISRSTAITYGIGEAEDAVAQPYFRNAKIGGQKVLAIIQAFYNSELTSYLRHNPNFQSIWYQDKNNYNDKGGTVYYIPFDAEGSAAEDAFEGVMGRFGIVKYANGKVAFATKDIGEKPQAPNYVDPNGDTRMPSGEFVPSGNSTELGKRLGMPQMRFAVDHGKLAIYNTEARKRDLLKRAFGGKDAISNRGKRYVKSSLRWDADNSRWLIPMAEVPKALWDEIGEVEDLYTPITHLEQLDATAIRSLNDNPDAMEATLLGNMLRADIVPLESTNSGLSDKLLAQRASDDPAALGELYKRYMVDVNRTKGGLPGIINRVCARYGVKPNAQLVEDVASQVWAHPTRGIIREVSTRPDVYRNYEFTTILFNKANNFLKDLLEQMRRTGEVTLDQPNRTDERVDDVDQLVADNPDMASRLRGGDAADEKFFRNIDWNGRPSREESIEEARNVLADIADYLTDERGEMLRAMLRGYYQGGIESSAINRAAKETNRPVGVFRNEWNTLKDLIRTKKYLLPENMAGGVEGATYSDEELMDMMPEAMANAVELRLQGMNARQIAEKLGATQPNVVEQLRRAATDYGISYPRTESEQMQYEFDFAWDDNFRNKVYPRKYTKKLKVNTRIVQDDLFAKPIDTTGKSLEDIAYETAIITGDMETAQRMLANKLGENMVGGIVPFVATHLNYYQPTVRKIAYGLKANLQSAVGAAAPEMAKLVPSDAVLVPMPSHNGMAEETLTLAEAIAKIANVPVANILTGKKRVSMYAAKRAHQIPDREELKMTVKGEVPKGKRVFVVDNVVNTGTSAREAVDAFDGKATVLAYAYSDADIAKVEGLKNASVTYNGGKPIPLSQRFDRSNPDILFADILPLENWKSPVTPAEDAAYVDAVKRGDMETCAKMVREAAARSWPNTKVVDEDGKPLVVYHGGKDDTFTIFEHGHSLENGVGAVNEYTDDEDIGFYFSPNKEYASQYAGGKEPRAFFVNIKNPYVKGGNSDWDGRIDNWKSRKFLTEVMVRNANQIKSADPVTYDDAGNVIPLSQRFNPNSDSILYSAIEPLETIQANIPGMIERAKLYGMHNAAVDEFRKANGMPELKSGKSMTREQILAPGEAMANNEVEMENLVSLHLANPKLPANADTQAAFTAYGVRLAGRIADLKDGMAEAVANGNMPLSEQLQGELDETMVKYDRAAKASRNVGRQWAYAGIARQGKFSPDMSYAEYATAMNEAAGGKPTEKQKRVIEAVWEELHKKNIAVSESHIRDIVRMIDESLVPAWLSKTVTDSVKLRRAVSPERIEENYFEALRQARHHGQMTGGVLEGLPNGQKWIRSMIAYYVNTGEDIYDANGKPDNRKVVPLLQKDLLDCGIDATPYEIRQMESRMGNATQPSKDETSVMLRDLHAQMLVEQQIAYMLQFGELPPKTGWMRDADSAIARELRKERIATEKRLGLDSAKSERRLASLLDAAKTRVRNQIADIDEKIRILENGGTLPAEAAKTGLTPDEELLNLRSQLKMRNEILAELDADGEHEKKVVRVLNALKRRAAILRERNAVAAANPTEEQFDKPEKQKVKDPRIDAARKEIAELNKEFDDLKASLFPEGTQKEQEAWHARRMNTLAKSLDRWNTALNEYNAAVGWEAKNKALHPITRKPPKESEDTLKAKKERDAAYRKVQDLRNKLERENTRGGRLLAAFKFASSAPALLRTVGDMSVALVQGGRGFNSHPILWSKALAAGTAAMFRKSSADKLVEGLKSHPYFEDFKEYGGHVYSMDGLEDGDIPEDFRVLSESMRIQNWPLVKQSARGFSGFLNHLNLSLYQAMVEAAGSGMGGANDNIKRDIAKFVNITTGYGYEKKTDRKEILGAVANVLDGLAWAPRKAIAELKYATGLDLLEPYWGSKRSEKSAKDIRRAMGAIGKEKMRFVLGMAAYTIAATLIGNMLGGENDWEEILNPLSTDFLRPKIGNTRLRPAAGLEIVWRTLARLVTGRTNTNGVTKDANRGDTLTRFLRGKLTPWIATAWDFFTGKTATGQDIKTSPSDIVKNYVLPITWSSEWENFALNDPISAVVALLPIFYGGSAYTAETDTLARADAQRKDLDRRMNGVAGDGTDDALIEELSAKKGSAQYEASAYASNAIKIEKKREDLATKLADFQARVVAVNDEIAARRKRGLMPTDKLAKSKADYEKAIADIEKGIADLDAAIPGIRKDAEDRVKAFRWGSVDSWRAR